MLLHRNASSAWSEMSVFCNSVGSRSRIRATSNATLPFPTTTARSPDKSNVMSA
jgi:hypothetical protein